MTQAHEHVLAAGSPAKSVRLRCGFVAACLAAVLLPRVTLAQGNVVTIGDSWAWLVAANSPGSAPPAPGFASAMQNMLNAFHPGKVVYNESFAGGTAAQHAADLAGITARINAHPDADIVLLSSGGNDMLLGALGGGFFLGNANNPAVYNNIAQHVNTVVNHILSIRPDIQVVIQGYDYINLWDGALLGAAGDTYRANYGMIRAQTGNPLLDLVLNVQQNAQLNQGFRDAESGKINIANNSRRVHHINNFGLNTALAGYNGFLGFVLPSGVYPPDIAPDAPVTGGLLNDPIHLNTFGYQNLANRAEATFFDTAFDAAVLSTNTGTLNFGATRVGTTSGSLSVTASNAGANFTKVKDLIFGAASGDFAGAALAVNPLFQDPLLGSDTASNAYQFSPDSRGVHTQNVSLTSNSGSPGLLLQGLGVGPEFLASAASVDFGTAVPNEIVSVDLDLSNITSDGDLGALTDLTVISAQFMGPDAALFSLSGFSPLTVLEAGFFTTLTLEVQSATPGVKTAMLSILTDQGAAFGSPGALFEIPVTVSVVPEPAGGWLAATALAALAFLVGRRRRGAALVYGLGLALATAGAARAQTATHNIPISGGSGFSGTLGGSIAAAVKLHTNDASQFTFGVLNVTDLDVVTISDGGFGNLFPDSVSLDNQGAALIAIAPTGFGIDIPTTGFGSPVSGVISVTAGDNLADAVPGAIDPGVVGSDGAWDDPGATGVLNSAQVNNFHVAVNNPIVAPAAVAGGTIAAVFPGNVTIPRIVNTSSFDVDLVIKDTSVVVVDFHDAQNLSIQNLSLSTTQVSPVTNETSNFVEAAHPTGYPQRDLSVIEGNLVATTVTGTLVADLQGTIFGSIDLRADIDLFGLVEVPVHFEDAIHGVLDSGTLISINESLNLPGTELLFGFTILHEPTTNVDFDDVFAALKSGTFGLSVPFSLSETDMILNVPPASFEQFNLIYPVDAGFFAQGIVWIPHFSGQLGGQIVMDLNASFSLSADLVAEAYLANAINVNAVPEPGARGLSLLAAGGLVCVRPLGRHARRRRPATGSQAIAC